MEDHRSHSDRERQGGFLCLGRGDPRPRKWRSERPRSAKLRLILHQIRLASSPVNDTQLLARITMELANSDKVASYRRTATGLAPWISLAVAVALAGYAGALWAGNSSTGWYCLVVAIAASFWLIFLGIHTQEQEQTAALLEYMIELSENAQKASRERGV